MKKLITLILATIALFTVMSVNVFGDENSSASANKTDIKEQVSLAIPVLEAKADGEYAINLSWNKVDGADKYIVYKYNLKSGEYLKLAETRNLFLKLTKLTPGTEYKFKIKAMKCDNTKVIYSKVSNSVSAITEEWHYYWGYDGDSYGIIKSKNEENKTRIFSFKKSTKSYLSSFYQRIVREGEWLYFCGIDLTSTLEEISLCRIKTDGSSFSQLAIGSCIDTEHFFVHNGFLYYYFTWDDYPYLESSLYRIPVDGSLKDRETIWESDECLVDEMKYVNNALYIYPYAYVNIGSHTEYTNCPTLKIQLNKKDLSVKEIGNDNLYPKVYYSGKAVSIYYNETHSPKKVGKFDVVDNILVKDEWIYFVGIENYNVELSEKEPCSIYKVKIDGTELTTIYTDKLYWSPENYDLYVEDDWIYFDSPYETDDCLYHKLYKIKTDGTELTEIEDRMWRYDW